MLPQQSLSKPKAGFTPPMMGWLREYFVIRDIGTDALLGSTLKKPGSLTLNTLIKSSKSAGMIPGGGVILYTCC
jgi:hypothetical protein